jgi:hypothetical protein
MTYGPEHAFISEAVHTSLVDFADTRLLGLREAQRRTFDYGCLVLRDLSRPLVSQVLWNHEQGIEKDIRTLLFEAGASLKLYFVRDNVKNRARIDEIIQSFRRQSSTVTLLRGLRLIPVPDCFDADCEQQRSWMTSYLRNYIASDLLFAVIFGKLAKSDVATFADHGGLIGLKLAALYLVTIHGLDHNPTFEQRLGYRGSSLREVITMLGGTGLIGGVSGTVCRIPTLKGRFFLDLCRRIMFEHLQSDDWSPELSLILSHLGVNAPNRGEPVDPRGIPSNVVTKLIHSIEHSKSQFGVDIMANINFKDPIFYSDFEWRKFASPHFMADVRYYDDEDDLDLFQQ